MNKKKLFLSLAILIVIIIMVILIIAVNRTSSQITSDEVTIKQAKVESGTIIKQLTNSMEVSSRFNRKSRITCYLLF